MPVLYTTATIPILIEDGFEIHSCSVPVGSCAVLILEFEPSSCHSFAEIGYQLTSTETQPQLMTCIRTCM